MNLVEIDLLPAHHCQLVKVSEFVNKLENCLKRILPTSEFAGLLNDITTFYKAWESSNSDKNTIEILLKIITSLKQSSAKFSLNSIRRILIPIRFKIQKEYVSKIFDQSDSWDSLTDGLKKYHSDLQRNCTDSSNIIPKTWERLLNDWFDKNVPEKCLKFITAGESIPTKDLLQWTQGPWLESIFSMWATILLEKHYGKEEIKVYPRILVTGNSGVTHEVDTVGRCGRFTFIASCKNQAAEVKHIRDLVGIMQDIDVPHGIYVVAQRAQVEVQKFASYHHILVLDRFPSSPQILTNPSKPRNDQEEFIEWFRYHRKYLEFPVN